MRVIKRLRANTKFIRLVNHLRLAISGFFFLHSLPGEVLKDQVFRFSRLLDKNFAMIAGQDLRFSDEATAMIK